MKSNALDSRSIAKLIDEEDWIALADAATNQEIVRQLSLNDCLRIAQIFLYSRPREDLDERGLELIKVAKEHHAEKWTSSWKYQGFLAEAHELLWRYDEKFAAYQLALKMALEQTGKAPPGLLLRMARCAMGPPDPPASLQQAVEWAKQAVAECPYVDGVWRLIALYKRLGDQKEVAYWAKVLKRIKKTGKDTPPIKPSFLIDEPGVFDCMPLWRPPDSEDALSEDKNG